MKNPPVPTGGFFIQPLSTILLHARRMKTLSFCRIMLLTVAVTSFGVCAPVQASEGGKSEGEGGKDAKTAGNPSVQLGAVAIPVTVDGRLANYIFLNIRIDLTITANEAKLREKEPYFRDALVRTAAKVSFAQAGKDYLLDEPRFKQVMAVEWAKITGPNVIKSIDVLSQSPKRHPY
jgi:flagellar basal body-associated protein FliL